MPRRAFTLLEVTLVAVLLVMLAAMAYPSIEAIYGDVRLTAAADQIRARWADARSHAVEEGRPYRFAVIPQTGQYRVAPDTDEYWPGDAPAADDVMNNLPPLELEETLPKGVKFADSGNGGGAAIEGESSGEWTTLVRFQPDGSADRDVEISFQASGTSMLVLKLRALTGSVTAKNQTGQGGTDANQAGGKSP